MGQQETAIAELEKELKELDTNMKLANSPGMEKQDQQNSKTLKNYMTNQDKYMRLVKTESEEIQCKFRSGVRWTGRVVLGRSSSRFVPRTA